MPAFYRALVRDFLHASETEILGCLTRAHAQEFQQQLSEATKVWLADAERLQQVLHSLVQSAPSAADWSVLLEFVIPRKEKRIDVVLLAGNTILLLEQKSGPPTKEDCLQVEEYALLLHYFHQPSHRRPIVPFVVSPHRSSDLSSRQQELAFTETAAFWITPVRRVSWQQLALALLPFAHPSDAASSTPEQWDTGEYFPVPSIIEAARTLQSGLTIREIAHSRAAQHDITDLTSFVSERVANAKASNSFTILFVTGVPGSGKTLVGLNLAFSSRGDGDTLSFMSGNGPLVDVLQALFADYRHRIEKFPAPEAKRHAKTLIENVHLFAKTYTETTPHATPSNHVVIFDEAQRAWNREHSFAKFKREFSEPEMFLRIMARHQDWAVIIALVGGGQEISSGEAGLAEWGKALAASNSPWKIYASPDVVRGGDSVAGTSLEGSADKALAVIEDDRLHLKVSVRSLNAENYSKWVNAVIIGDSTQAARLKHDDPFPVYLTRDLAVLRSSLRQQTLGHRRCGLVGSSKAERLRAEGLEPDASFHGGYPWDKWFLAPSSDVRASTQLEVYATEFEIQGLELDWIGLCWGGDLIWSKHDQKWLTRKFRNAANSGWISIKGAAHQQYRLNSYRVLLTRARQGVVLFVPRGDSADSTRSPLEFDETADFLVKCGVRPIGRAADFPIPDPEQPEPMLF